MSRSRSRQIRPTILSCLTLILLALSVEANLTPMCPSFVQPAGTPVYTDYYLVSLAVGDFNGDGKLDFAAVSDNSHNVSIRLGNGEGGFTAAAGSPVGVGSWPASIAVGDFNRDGKLDLAVANSQDNNVSILLGNGLGGFAVAEGSPVGVGSSPRSVAVGDFDGDGILDLAVANTNGGNVSILLGDGAGKFAAADGSPVGVGNAPRAVAVGDFNGDGNLDLAVANRGSDSVIILLGGGSGGFSPAASSPVNVGSHPVSLAVGDFDGDGKLDLAVVNNGDRNVSILPGDGAGGFTGSGSTVDVGIDPTSVAVGDFDGDGKIDLVVANAEDNNASILLGNGTGGFAASGSPVGAGSYALFVAAGDFNGDGKLDFLAVNEFDRDVSVFLNTCDAITCTNTDFDNASGSPFSTGDHVHPSSVAIGDFNGDGRADLVVTNTDSNVGVFLGGGDGTFGAMAEYVAGKVPMSVAVGDFNGDGKADLAVGNAGSDNVSILLGNGSGGFAAASGSPVGAGGYPISIAVGDFNRDGKLDLAVVKWLGGRVSVLLGNGTGGFIDAPDSPVSVGPDSYPASIVVGDFNRDGKLDLAVANQNADDLSVLLGNGDGTFQAKVDYGTGASPISVAVGDFNGDGNLDLAVANLNSANVSVLLGQGDGTFAPGLDYGTGVLPYSVAVGDFNRDGKADLGVSNWSDKSVSILLGNGNGTFQAKQDFPLGSISDSNSPDPFSIAVGDFDRNGKMDFATTNYNGSTVSVLLNACTACSSTTTTVSAASTKYSDPVALWATVTSTSTVNAGTVTFLVNGDTIGTADVINGTATLAVAGQTKSSLKDHYPNLKFGSYTIQADYSGASGFCGSTNTDSLTVGREDAVVNPSASNAGSVRVNSAGGTAGPVTLCADVTEALDDYAGDTGNAVPVTVTLTPIVGSGTLGPVTATITGGGVGATLQACATFSNIPVNVYTVRVSVGGDYYTGAGYGVLAIYDPSLGFVSGGGAIINPNTGMRATFGFTAKYQKKGGVQGSALYIEREPDGGISTVKASSLKSLSIVGNTAVILSKNVVFNGVGNYGFQITAVDNGDSGTTDQCGWTLTNPGGSGNGEYTFPLQTILGGNIQVPHKGR